MKTGERSMSDLEVREQCDRIRQCSFDLHTYLRQGHHEKVYKNGLAHRLRKSGLEVVKQYPIDVYDLDGTFIGGSYADSAPFESNSEN